MSNELHQTLASKWQTEITFRIETKFCYNYYPLIQEDNLFSVVSPFAVNALFIEFQSFCLQRIK